MNLTLQKTILIALTAVLMSCQMSSNLTTIAMNPALVNALPTTLTLDGLTVRVDLEQLNGLADEDVPYLLYVGNPSCSSCLQFQPILLEWIASSRAMVYYLDTLQHLHHLTMIQEEFPKYFPEGFSTPTLFVFQGMERIHRIGSNQAFYNNERFQALMNDIVSISSVLT